ncbi:hypothetical protein [Cellulomonas sp. A375-1]|uniref:hypothetical protein n=1 Tax=Cellulomonas sp. A375-1 TaxID=1672219 RepID=UPI00069FFA60|nr:hypothetical protein [Cellulomonas sp. A375-1]
MTQTPNANDVLMGGGGAPTAKFAHPGDTITGRVVAPPQAYQEREYDKNNPGRPGDPKYYPSGDPIMAVYVDLATDMRDPSIQDDDGIRRFYIEGRYLKADVRDAIRAAGAPGLEVGATLTVTFTHREDPDDKRSRKFWQITYVPAGNAALMGEQPTPAPAPTTPVAAGAQPTTAPAPTPPPPAAAPAAPAVTTPAAQAKSLAALGLTVEQIAAQLGITPDVAAILVAA